MISHMSACCRRRASRAVLMTICQTHASSRPSPRKLRRFATAEANASCTTSRPRFSIANNGGGHSPEIREPIGVEGFEIVEHPTIRRLKRSGFFTGCNRLSLVQGVCAGAFF